MFPVEAFRATVTKAVETFQRFGIRFHLTGGIASVYYGEPRMTQDIDIVIDNAQTAKSLLAFLETLDASDFIFNPDSVRAAIAQRSMFFVMQAEANEREFIDQMAHQLGFTRLLHEVLVESDEIL